MSNFYILLAISFIYSYPVFSDESKLTPKMTVDRFYLDYDNSTAPGALIPKKVNPLKKVVQVVDQGILDSLVENESPIATCLMGVADATARIKKAGHKLDNYQIYISEAREKDFEEISKLIYEFPFARFYRETRQLDLRYAQKNYNQVLNLDEVIHRIGDKFYFHTSNLILQIRNFEYFQLPENLRKDLKDDVFVELPRNAKNLRVQCAEKIEISLQEKIDSVEHALQNYKNGRQEVQKQNSLNAR